MLQPAQEIVALRHPAQSQEAVAALLFYFARCAGYTPGYPRINAGASWTWLRPFILDVELRLVITRDFLSLSLSRSWLNLTGSFCD